MAWDDDEPQAADTLAAHEHKVLAEVRPATIDRMAIINRPVKIVEADLRDEFAAQAMQSLLNDFNLYGLDSLVDDGRENEGNQDRVNRIARVSYEIADAMLKARKL